MAALIGALRVTLGANTANYEAGMRRAQTTARRTGRDISTSLQSAQRTAVNAFRGIAAAAGIVGVGSAGAAFLRYADAAKQLEAQLRLATRESGSFAQAQRDVTRVASVTRTGIEETADLYAAFQRNSRELGISQREAARLTETVSKAFQISGATAAEAAGGLRQLMQGLQSGTLRGEELNSVLENAPRLARALADGLGVTIGQLREMGKEGELTGQAVTQALLQASETIDAEFTQIPVTFDQAMTLVRNAAIETFGAFDRGGQFSQALASFFQQGSEGFRGMASDAEVAGASIRSTMAALSDVFGPMVSGAGRDFGAIAGLAEQLRDAIAAVMTDLQWAYNQYVRVANAVDNFGANVVNPVTRFFNPWIPEGGGTFARGNRQPATFADDFNRRQQNEFRARTSNAGIIAAAQEQFRIRPPATGPSAAGGGGGGGSRRRGGGGRARAPRPAQRVEPSDFASPWVEGDTVAEMEARSRYWREIETSVVDVSEHLREIPSLDNIFTQNARDNMLDFAAAFKEDLAGGLAEAVVYGRNLGDVLENTLKRAAAALLQSGLMNLFSGAFGKGGFLGSIFGSSAFSSFGYRAGGGPAVAGRSYMVGENGPEVLTMGAPGHITPGGMGRLEIILRDEMLDARIEEGAGIVVTRAAPAIIGETQRRISDNRRRG